MGVNHYTNKQQKFSRIKDNVWTNVTPKWNVTILQERNRNYLHVIYLTMLSVSDTIEINNWMIVMNWKDIEGSGCSLY